MIDVDNLVGQQIGNYQLSRLIACGAYGNVYLGQHWLFKDELAVAVKVLNARLGDKKQRELFLREAYLLRKLKHPAILPLIDAGVHHGIPYLVTLYAPGGSLRTLLENQQGQPLSLEKSLWILARLGEALGHAHSRHVVHRDLKPENVLFGPRGELYLADFGLAVVLEANQTGFVDSHGTPLYMAPEQFEGYISSKSDQYAFACLGYELLTGRRPFLPPNLGWETVWFHHARVVPLPPSQFNPLIPERVEQALLRALAKDRAARYRSMADLLRALNPATFRQAKDSPLSTCSMYEHPIVSARARVTKLPPASGHTAMQAQEFQTQARPTNTLETSALTVNTLGLPDQAPDVYRKQGNAFRDAGVYDRALQAYERAIQLDPSDPLAHYGKARIYWDQNRYDEALQAYDTIVRLQPNDPFFHALKGNALCELGHYPAALASYDQALALKQDNAGWYARRASILYELHRYVEALASYDLALALKPNEAYYYTCKGDILSELKQEEEARQMYARARQHK